MDLEPDSETHSARVANSDKLKFWAFVSYSHANESWAAWLHSGIERFKIPSDLVGRKTRRLEIPKRLFPVFRDRAELASSSSLPEGIREALRQSRYLVVICSPQTTSSRWVGEEIRYFKSLGREDRVLCMVVDGEPYASDRTGDASREAFPAAVRFATGADGALTEVKAEPLAADARPQGDGRENAKLKLIAGMLGVGFDELKRRDRRRRRKQSVKLAVLTAMVVAVFVGVWIILSGRVAEQRALANVRELASRSERLLNRQSPDARAGVLLSVLAMRRSMKLGQPSASAYGALRTGIDLLPNRPVANISGARLSRASVFSYDGGRLATTDVANIFVWDAATGEELVRIPLESGQEPEFLTLNRDGERLAFVDGSTARIVRISSGRDEERLDHGQFLVNDEGELVLSLFGPPDEVRRSGWPQGALSPSGRLMATADNQHVDVWDTLREGRMLRINAGSEVHRMTWAPDERRLATSGAIQTLVGAQDSMTQLWDISTGQQHWRIEHDDYVNGTSFSPDGRWIAIGVQNGVIRVHEAATGETRATIVLTDADSAGSVRPVFDPSGRGVASPDGRAARIWDAATGGEVANLLHSEPVENVLFSPAGALATMTASGLLIWEVITGRQIARALSVGELLTDIALGQGGEVMAVAGVDGTVRVWAVAAGLPRPLTEVDANPRPLIRGISGDGQRMATQAGVTLGHFRRVGLWDVETGRQVAVLEPGDSVHAVTFSRDGRRLATIEETGQIVVWDSATGQEIRRLPQASASAVVFTSGGDRLATSGGGRLRIWDIASGTEMGGFSSDAELTVWGTDQSGENIIVSDGAVLRLWQPDAQRESRVLTHEAAIGSVGLDSTGSRVAVALKTGAIIVWDIENDSEPVSLLETAPVHALCFAADRDWLVTVTGGHSKRSAQVWSLAGGARVATLFEGAEAIACEPGPRVAAGWRNGRVSLSLWSPEDLAAEACKRLERNFTRVEWEEYLPGEACQAICPGLPEPAC